MAMTATETVEGQVESTNERGLRLKGETEWRNYSKFAEGLEPAARGATVRLSLDSKGFIRGVETLSSGSPNGTAAAYSPTRERTITRLAVLKAAANFVGLMGQTHEEVTSEHVLRLADKWVAWVEREPEEAPPP